MMKSLKHNKIKNTAVIFEVLTTKLVSEVMNGVAIPKSLSIIKKHFNQKSILFKELALYKSLLNKAVLQKDLEKYIDLMIESRKRLSEVHLKTAKYNVIKDIKKTFGDEFINTGFNVKLRNYREMASVYKLFEYDSVDNPAQILECRNVLIETLSNDNSVITEESEWSKLTKDVRHLGFKRLIEKFNEKYDSLSSRQKKLLQTLINKPDKLQEHVHSEIKLLKKELSEINNISDEATRIKIEQIPSLLDNILTSKINDNHVAVILRVHQLLNEIKNER